MRVLVAMSGGVDSSLAAALLLESGHEVVGATMKLWGGPQDSGCCSVSDVEDARRVADQLGIDHHVFNFSDDFAKAVVAPYVVAHAAARTPNPCVECNRHLKFDRLLARATILGFEVLATGHHARIDAKGNLVRGRDPAKDQSYVLAVLTRAQLGRLSFPVGEMTKIEVRARARDLGLATADKADSQDVCFIAAGRGGREGFLASRIPLHPGRVVESGTGRTLGSLPAVELVTVGPRRGLATSGAGRRYVLDVDLEERRVTVGGLEELLSPSVALEQRTWVDEPLAAGSPVLAQMSAHGRTVAATVSATGLDFATPTRRVAPGQLVAYYVGDRVVGSGVAR